MSNYREALEAMVCQFGLRRVIDNRPVIHTGGYSALEIAFETLGWEDPHYLPDERYTCKVEGCMEPGICRIIWEKWFLRLCSKHYEQAHKGIVLPPVKHDA